MPRALVRERVERFLGELGTPMPVDRAIRERAEDLVDAGFGRLDALHLACAEAAGSDTFATVDDRLALLARRAPGRVLLVLESPIEVLARFEREEHP